MTTDNPLLIKLVEDLKKKSFDEEEPIWKRLALDLEKPSRQKRVVNLYKINKLTKEKDMIVVPGKVLSIGDLDHYVTVAAFAFSKSALEKINKAGKAMSINELMKERAKDKKIRILG